MRIIGKFNKRNADVPEKNMFIPNGTLLGKDDLCKVFSHKPNILLIPITLHHFNLYF